VSICSQRRGIRPAFIFAVTFASAVEVWGFRFAGPSATTWIRAHILVAGAAAADLGGIRWQAGELSPAPRSSATFDDIEVGKTTPWNNLGVFESYGVAVSDARSVIAVGGTQMPRGYRKMAVRHGWL